MARLTTIKMGGTMGLFGPPDIEKLRTNGDVPRLIKALAYQKDANVRKAAVEALEDRHDARAVEPLIAALKDSDAFVRRAAVQALGQLKDARAVEPLIPALSQEHSRREAAQALGRLKDARAVQPLIAALAPGESSWGREEILLALGELKDARAVEPLIGALDERGTSEFAAWALGELGDRRAIEPLVAHLGRGSGSNPNEQIALALVKLGAESVDPLLGALRDGEQRDTRRYAAEALGLLGDPRAVEPLISALDDNDGMVHLAAAKSLGMIRDPRAIAPLASRLDGEAYFAVALVQIGGDDAEQAVFDYWLRNPYAPQYWQDETIFAVVSRAERTADSRAAEPLNKLFWLIERGGLRTTNAVREAAAAALKRIGDGTQAET